MGWICFVMIMIMIIQFSESCLTQGDTDLPYTNLMVERYNSIQGSYIYIFFKCKQTMWVIINDNIHAIVSLRRAQATEFGILE